jgi:hypothetical protein
LARRTVVFRRLDKKSEEKDSTPKEQRIRIGS